MFEVLYNWKKQTFRCQLGKLGDAVEIHDCQNKKSVILRQNVKSFLVFLFYEELVFLFISYFYCVCLLSHVQLFVTLWTVAPQAPLSMGFSRQDYWSGLPCLLQGMFPTQGLNQDSRVSCIAVVFFTTSATWEPLSYFYDMEVQSPLEHCLVLKSFISLCQLLCIHRPNCPTVVLELF